MRRLFIAFAAATLLVGAANAEPSTTTFVVPYPPGGGTDITARAYAEAMRGFLKRNIVVVNRPGAGGLAGAAYVAKARHDGSVILLGNVFIGVLAKMTHHHLEFDPTKELVPVSLLARTDIGLATGPGTPAKTLKEFIAWAKANPQKAVFGNPAAGSVPYLFGLLLAREARIPLRPVQYKGIPAMNNDVISGRVASMTGAVSGMVPLYKAGRIRILATGGAKRMHAAPDVPTFAESGYPKINASSWFAIFAPAGISAKEVALLSKAARQAASDPRVKKAIKAIGIDVVTSTPEELQRLIDDDHARWAPVVKESGYSAD